MNDTDWKHQAACKGLTPMFFSERGDHSWDEAKKVCADCPVIVACREAGTNEKFGVWGGRSERERARRPSEPAHGTPERYWSERFACRCDECSAAHAAYRRRVRRVG